MASGTAHQASINQPTESIEGNDHIPDDIDYNSDLFNLDSEWEVGSACSTEPDEEFFEDMNQIEIYRQLHGVDASTQLRRKRMTVEIVKLDGDSDSALPLPKKKKKKVKQSKSSAV